MNFHRITTTDYIINRKGYTVHMWEKCNKPPPQRECLLSHVMVSTLSCSLHVRELTPTLHQLSQISSNKTIRLFPLTIKCTEYYSTNNTVLMIHYTVFQLLLRIAVLVSH